MSQKNLLETFGIDSTARVEAAIEAMRRGRGVLVVDNENRENEGDLVFAAETMTTEPYSSQLSSGASFTVVAVDVFGLSGNSVSIYHEIPSYLPAGTFSFEKTSSSSSAAFSRSFKGFDKIRGSAFGLLPYSIAQSCR